MVVQISGNVKVAEYACNQLMELDYGNTDYHVLLANIYASCGKWNEVSKVRSVIRGKGQKKSPGYAVSCIHSTGELLTGYDAVMQNWQLAFSWGQGVAFPVQNLRARLLTDMAWLTMKTYVDMETEPFHVTNVYEFHNGQWFLVHHHNSLMLTDAELQNQNGFG
ncbi:hypothetical protein IFM89_034270 [Coptis chinensis]|uniref:SnoaL-like domain-containing protein n=1 Tax=Coptis chinensis TaxID=261450 RepID=A0A835HAL5_9MAGN|nr:hypothetical protein IFM89_034270 [Coptis chinensis]